MAPAPTRSRFVILALFAMAVFTFMLLTGNRPTYGEPSLQVNTKQDGHIPNGAILQGHAIAPKLGNATAKYVWQLLHA